MLAWLVAVSVGVVVALLQHGLGSSAGAGFGRRIGMVLLRAVGVAGVVALALNAPAGPARAMRPVVAVDASASWLRARGGDSSAWRAVLARARAVSAESVWYFGDSVRAGSAPAVPSDAATLVEAVADRALASGRPVVIVTDGEVDDPAALADLPDGSRVEMITPVSGPDVAVSSFDAPRAMVGGDTLVAHVTVSAGARVPTAAGRVVLLLDGREVASGPLDPIGPHVDREIDLRGRVPDDAGDHILSAAVRIPGDAEPRNDTLSRALEVSRSAGVVVVATAPDEDLRYALAVMRGTLALPVRAALRVAPGSWRSEGTLAPVAESEVRAEARAAPVLVLQGDTAMLGKPDSLGRGGLVLVPGALPQRRSPDADEAAAASEWYATSAPPSPLSGVLQGISWDSLPPLDAGGAPSGEWSALEIRRARQFDPRAAVAGSTRPRRRVTVAVSGMWRWAFRGGSSAEAFAAMWGSLLDWVAVERGDARAAIPADGLVRAGEPIVWRRSARQAAADSSVRVVLARRGRPAREDSMTLRFAPGTTVASSPPLAAGLWDATVPGGRALLVVNASREWLPRSPTVRGGAVGTRAALDTAPRVRGSGWIALLTVAALCLDWMLRRRAGLR